MEFIIAIVGIGIIVALLFIGFAIKDLIWAIEHFNFYNLLKELSEIREEIKKRSEN